MKIYLDNDKCYYDILQEVSRNSKVNKMLNKILYMFYLLLFWMCVQFAISSSLPPPSLSLIRKCMLSYRRMKGLWWPTLVNRTHLSSAREPCSMTTKNWPSPMEVTWLMTLSRSGCARAVAHGPVTMLLRPSGVLVKGELCSMACFLGWVRSTKVLDCQKFWPFLIFPSAEISFVTANRRVPFYKRPVKQN